MPACALGQRELEKSTHVGFKKCIILSIYIVFDIVSTACAININMEMWPVPI